MALDTGDIPVAAVVADTCCCPMLRLILTLTSGRAGAGAVVAAASLA